MAKTCSEWRLCIYERSYLHCSLLAALAHSLDTTEADDQAKDDRTHCADEQSDPEANAIVLEEVDVGRRVDSHRLLSYYNVGCRASNSKIAAYSCDETNDRPSISSRVIV